MMKMDQAFPFHFCILQVIKNWTVGRPGNEASGYHAITLTKLTILSLLSPWVLYGRRLHNCMYIYTHTKDASFFSNNYDQVAVANTMEC